MWPPPPPRRRRCPAMYPPRYLPQSGSTPAATLKKHQGRGGAVRAAAAALPLRTSCGRTAGRQDRPPYLSPAGSVAARLRACRQWRGGLRSTHVYDTRALPAHCVGRFSPLPPPASFLRFSYSYISARLKFCPHQLGRRRVRSHECTCARTCAHARIDTKFFYNINTTIAYAHTCMACICMHACICIHTCIH